jgi:hypothetical protein
MGRSTRIGSWSLATGLALATLVTAALAQGPVIGLAKYPQSGKLLQTVNAFDNPEGTIFSTDGRDVFVSNSAELGMPEKGFHWTEKAGFISKLAVQPDGTLTMVEPRLVTGLTAPLGMAVNPVPTRLFPRGAIFLCTGGFPLADAQGNSITDPTRLTSKIVVFDVTGKILGEIPWTVNSFLASIGGGPATLPNAAGFDRQGNFYVSDTGLANGSPGVFMIPHAALDDLASGRIASETPLFLAMPGAPDGVEVSPVDGAIHVNTVGVAAGINDSARGGMYRLTLDDFRRGRLPAPFSQDWGALDGLVFTPPGTRLDTQILPPNYITVLPHGSTSPMVLTIDGLNRPLAGPADIAVFRRPDGSALLLVPELSALSPNKSSNPVDVVLLPAGF